MQFEIYVTDRRNIPNAGTHRLVYEIDTSLPIKKITVSDSEYPFTPRVNYITSDGRGHEARFIRDEGDIVWTAGDIDYG